MASYPAYRYHGEASVIVSNEADDAALGKGWSDHPSKVDPKASLSEKQRVVVARLQREQREREAASQRGDR